MNYDSDRVAEYLTSVEALAEDILSDKHSMTELDRRRNKNREAIRVLMNETKGMPDRKRVRLSFHMLWGWNWNVLRVWHQSFCRIKKLIWTPLRSFSIRISCIHSLTEQIENVRMSRRHLPQVTHCGSGADFARRSKETWWRNREIKRESQTQNAATETVGKETWVKGLRFETATSHRTAFDDATGLLICLLTFFFSYLLNCLYLIHHFLPLACRFFKTTLFIPPHLDHTPSHFYRKSPA